MLLRKMSGLKFGPSRIPHMQRALRRFKKNAGHDRLMLHRARGDHSWFRFGFCKKGRTLHLAFTDQTIDTWPDTFMGLIPFLAVVLDRCDDGTRGIAEFSDGEDCGPGIVSQCGRHEDGFLIPDHIFIRTQGYLKTREMAASAPAFEEREDRTLWRGSTTGKNGAISIAGMNAETPGLLPRTRMCLLLRDVPRCDAKYVGIVQTDMYAQHALNLAKAGILAHGATAEKAWANVRYHVAVDGNTLAWSSTFTRLLLGCCVLKPESPGGYKQWYSTRFVEWEHYVPVKADMTDLADKIAWCRNNLSDAARIARNGQTLAFSMTYENEVSNSAAALSKAVREGTLNPSSDLTQTFFRALPQV